MTIQPEVYFEGVRKAFQSRVVLDSVSLALQPGSLLLLSGVNGAGKSTLMRIVAGLEKPDQGQFDLGDGLKSWKHSRQELLARTVYLHQSPFMFDGSVSYNLGYALPQNLSRTERQQQIDKAISWAGLEALASQHAKSLSGGERQRVALARAWLCNPQVLLLDEPTANMDTEAGNRTLTLLQTLKEEGHALVVASHDPAHFATLTNHHCHLDSGKLITLDHQEHVGQDTARITTLKRVRI